MFFKFGRKQNKSLGMTEMLDQLMELANEMSNDVAFLSSVDASKMSIKELAQIEKKITRVHSKYIGGK